MMAYEEKCNCILTDFGGVQKEAFFFGKPCITMRDSTEWVELVDSGWNTLVGANTDKIIETVQTVVTPSISPSTGFLRIIYQFSGAVAKRRMASA